ncbi:MAG: formylglycine-generating enzyme family protein [Spirochaetes bacterium]|nr:formylglycine-generating enzyme family protein [Spirochaetota bacterium]
MKSKKKRGLLAAITLTLILGMTSLACNNVQEPPAGEEAISPNGIRQVWVPSGTFTMGSPADEIGRSTGEEQRQVTLSDGFWMGVYPVTQEQWEAVMGSNPSYFNANPAAGETQGRRPVESVRWFDAIVFANRLSEREGLSPAYRINGSTNPDDWGAVPAWWASPNMAVWNAVEIVAGSNGWRLPTEAQWERAARAGTASAFYNGAQDWQVESDIDSVGWFDFNSGGMTREVGLKYANAWGLYDMHGNVFEWVFDSPPQTDLTAASSVSERLFRGGGWIDSALFARSGASFFIAPFFNFNYIGFRLVRPQ